MIDQKTKEQFLKVNEKFLQKEMVITPDVAKVDKSITTTKRPVSGANIINDAWLLLLEINSDYLETDLLDEYESLLQDICFFYEGKLYTAGHADTEKKRKNKVLYMRDRIKILNKLKRAKNIKGVIKKEREKTKGKKYHTKDHI